MTLLSHWPADPLRPGLSFPDFLRRRIEQEFGTLHPPNPSPPLAASAAVQEVEARPKFDEVYEKRQLNALSSLLENRYKKMVQPHPR